MFKVRVQSKATLDAKGRVALPAKLRRAAQDKHATSLVLTFHKGFIWGRTIEDFERLEEQWEARNEYDDAVLDFVQGVLATAVEVDIDRSGRIRVPPILREAAGIDRDVVINSVLNRIEIWDAEAWDVRLKEAMARASGASVGRRE